MKKKTRNITLLWLLISAISIQNANAAASANLNQARNGTDLSPTSPMNWVNGNVGIDQGHYNEEMSAPFQCIMTGLTAGVQVTLVIGYDVRNSSKNAYDYLTHYNRILPHNFASHSTPETIDPLINTGLASTTPYTTYPIPAPSSSGSTVPGQPSTSFNSLPAAERLMVLYNGTIDTIYYVSQGSLTASNSETKIAVTFTPATSTLVLVWGGHIGSRNDWGYTMGLPNSAGGISGSPFHMRLVSWTINNLGNQDRSLAGPAVGAPPAGPLPVALTDFHVHSTGEGNLVQWATVTEINNHTFTLERSASLSDFSPLTTIEGAGNSSVLVNYAWNDNNPLTGISYYRLVQTDFDGTQKIYGPVSVFRNEGLTSLTVVGTYPNPFSDNFTLTYFSAAKTVTTIEILDATGRQVSKQMINSAEGVNTYRIADNAMSEGIYFVSLSQANNNRVTAKITRR